MAKSAHCCSSLSSSVPGKYDSAKGHRGELTTATFLNQLHDSQLHSKYIFLHLRINVDLTSHQRNFFCQQDTDHCRNQQCVKIQITNHEAHIPN